MKESIRNIYALVGRSDLDVDSPEFQQAYDRERQASQDAQKPSGAAPPSTGAAPGQSDAASRQSGAAQGHSGAAPGHSGAAPREAESTSWKSEPEVEIEFPVGQGALTKEELDKVRTALQANMVLRAPAPQSMGPQYKVRPSRHHFHGDGVRCVLITLEALRA